MEKRDSDKIGRGSRGMEATMHDGIEKIEETLFVEWKGAVAKECENKINEI